MLNVSGLTEQISLLQPWGKAIAFPFLYTLQCTVNEFYGDYRVKPEAVVSVELFLSVTNAAKTNPLIGANCYSK